MLNPFCRLLAKKVGNRQNGFVCVIDKWFTGWKEPLLQSSEVAPKPLDKLLLFVFARDIVVSLGYL